MLTSPPIEVANLGMADSLILMVMALVVFGPRRLPQIGRQIGKLMYEFRKASNDFKFQMEEELRLSEDADRRKKEEAERQRIAALSPAVQPQLEASPPSIEAHADIGAVETPTAAGKSDEGEYRAQQPSQTPDESAEPVVTIPRIQPPWTGEQVSAARPGAPATVDVTPEGATGTEDEQSANSAVPIASEGSEPVPNPSIESPTPPSETVSQHG